MNLNKYKGDVGEQIAVDYLLTCGYRILHRNYRFGRLEVDIIAQHEGALYFVEVKCRHAINEHIMDFMPERAMTVAKRGNIERAAELYLMSNPYDGDLYIELVTVTFCNESYKVRHYKHWEY